MQQIDQSILFFFNGFHNRFFDLFFWYATKGIVYLPLYLIATWLAYKQFGNKIWILLLFVILTVALTDQSCNLIKHTVCRLRPTNNSEIASLIHVVNDCDGDEYRGGDYGFPSAHACNTFGMAMFLYCVMRPKRWGLTLAFFAWAAIMSYSRIYLGVHYPLDILCGAVLGVGIGWGMATLLLRVLLSYTSYGLKKKEGGEPPFF
jgi:undecaprenyl-diphosphatase